MFYESLNGKVKCHLCNHYCVISEGNRGICGVSENKTRFIRNVGVEIPWHITAFYPTFKLLNVSSTSVQSLRRARDIGLDSDMSTMGIFPGKAERIPIAMDVEYLL